jgi:hypothetical protein
MHRVLIGKPEGRRAHGKPMHSCDKIKTELEEI